MGFFSCAYKPPVCIFVINWDEIHKAFFSWIIYYTYSKIHIFLSHTKKVCWYIFNGLAKWELIIDMRTTTSKGYANFPNRCIKALCPNSDYIHLVHSFQLEMCLNAFICVLGLSHNWWWGRGIIQMITSLYTTGKEGQ